MSTATIEPLVTTFDSLDSWLAGRPAFIGASESPALFGVGYADDSPCALWDRKVNPQPEQVEREEFEWGHAMQPIILGMFQKKTGIHVIDPGPYTVLRSAERPYIGCTLDARGIDEERGEECVIECKNVGHFMGRDWDDETPLRVQVQVMHQLYVTGLNVGYAVACIGGRKLAYRRVERNDRFIDTALLPTLEKFWAHVKSGTMPPVDESAATARLLAKLWPEDDGSEIMLPDEAGNWDRELVEAKAVIKEAEAKKLAAENKLRAAMGTASYGVFPGGGYSLKSQTRAEHVVKASTFRVLRRMK